MTKVYISEHLHFATGKDSTTLAMVVNSFSWRTFVLRLGDKSPSLRVEEIPMGGRSSSLAVSAVSSFVPV
jgi:hypothetical protein